jgi:hypothetical protein
VIIFKHKGHKVKPQRPQILRALFVLLVTGLLVSCLLTGLDGDISPPGDMSFMLMGSANAVEQTRNITINHFERYAYTSDGNGIIGIYNIANPRDPLLVHSLRLQIGGDFIRNMEIDASRNLFIAAGRGGLFIVNVLNSQMPVILYENPSINARHLSFEDDHIAVATDNGWILYNRTALDHLFEIRTHVYMDSPSPRKVLLQYPWLFVANIDRLDIFDLNTPPQSQPERTIYYSNFRDFDVDANGVFMALVTQGGLSFIDISNPLNATVLHSMGNNLNSRVIRIAQGRLFIASNSNVHVFRLTSLEETPKEESRLDLFHVVQDIAFHQGYTLITQGFNGFEIYRYLP